MPETPTPTMAEVLDAAGRLIPPGSERGHRPLDTGRWCTCGLLLPCEVAEAHEVLARARQVTR